MTSLSRRSVLSFRRHYGLYSDARTDIPPDAPLALTDDEVIALAARRNVTRPSAVPTINLAQSASVAAAATRGVRSLVARQLLGPGGLVDPSGLLQALLDPLRLR